MARSLKDQQRVNDRSKLDAKTPNLTTAEHLSMTAYAKGFFLEGAGRIGLEG